MAEEQQRHHKVQAKEHESFGNLSLLTALIPPIGFVLGIVYLTKDRKLDKKLGEHLVALSVLFALIWSGTTYALLPHTAPLGSSIAPPPDVQSTPITPAAPSAHVGDTVQIGDLSVTVEKVIDPASGAYGQTADSGKRFVAVQVHLTNTSSAPVTGDIYNNLALTDSDGQNAEMAITGVTDCTNFSSGVYNLSAGASATGCGAFQVPDGVRPTKVQFSAVSNEGVSAFGEWLNP